MSNVLLRKTRKLPLKAYSEFFRFGFAFFFLIVCRNTTNHQIKMFHDIEYSVLFNSFDCSCCALHAFSANSFPLYISIYFLNKTLLDLHSTSSHISASRPNITNSSLIFATSKSHLSIVVPSLYLDCYRFV